MQHLIYPSSGKDTLEDLSSKLSFDAFSKLRVSQPFGLLESKFLYDKNDNIWEDVTDTSGVVTYLSNESAIKLEVGSGSNDYCLRQTYKYFPYIAGNSQRIFLSGNLEGKETGRVKRIGYFDNSNGLFFELASDDLYVVVRSSTSGSVIDTGVKRTSFNIDRLDGTGPSGITFDPTMRQIFMISFQWLGVGSVTFGFSFNGKIYPVHQVHNANTGLTTYMAMPNLPARFEIRNNGIATGTGVMKQVCTSIASEGGYQIPGYDFNANNNIIGKSISTTRVPIMAIRLKNSFNSKANRRIANLQNINGFVTGGNVMIDTMWLGGITATTATWTDVDDTSGMEYSTDISAYTSTHAHKINTSYLAAGNGQVGGALDATFTALNYNTAISQNYASNQSQMIVVYGQSLAGTVNLHISINWTEFE